LAGIIIRTLFDNIVIGSERSMMRWPFHLKVGQEFLACTLREPAEATELCILFLHGWGGNRETVGWLLDHLCQQGHHVLNFAQSGFDDSGGGRAISSWLPDAATMVDYITTAKLEPWVCGLSTGGSLAIALSAFKPEVRGCIALAPFASFPRLFQDRPDHRRTLEGTFSDLEAGMGALDAEEVIGKIAPRPLLLVHGDSDEVIPTAHSRLLFAKAGEPRQLSIVKGANHIFSNIDREGLCKLVSDWIADNSGGKAR
jgi:pimeloyl-ACP methyl ester carboxylesterase